MTEPMKGETPKHDELRYRAECKPLNFDQLEVWKALAETEKALHQRIMESVGDRATIRQLNQMLEWKEKELQQANARNAKLKEFAVHEYDCPKMVLVICKCTCGLEELLR